MNFQRSNESTGPIDDENVTTAFDADFRKMAEFGVLIKRECNHVLYALCSLSLMVSVFGLVCPSNLCVIVDGT